MTLSSSCAKSSRQPLDLLALSQYQQIHFPHSPVSSFTISEPQSSPGSGSETDLRNPRSGSCPPALESSSTRSPPTPSAPPPSPVPSTSARRLPTPSRSKDRRALVRPRLVKAPTRPAEPFFDPDVVFPSPLPPIEGDQLQFDLLEELSWEDWARLRVRTMVAKELPISFGHGSPIKCGLPRQVRREAVRWLLEFEILIKGYPPIAPHTRYRAVGYYSAFWSMRGLPNDMTTEMVSEISRISAVVSLMVATKVDVDVFRPLFVISIKIWATRVSKWIDVESKVLASFETVLLKALKYRITSTTPFDFVSELVIACEPLGVLMAGCGKQWEKVEEAFGAILEIAVQDQGYVQFRTSVLTTAALFLALDRSVLRHPGEEGSLYSWVRQLDGTWIEVSYTAGPKFVAVTLKGMDVMLAAQLTDSICATMHLQEEEVDQCKNWCRTL